MASNFLLYLNRKKLYQAVLCIGSSNFRIKLIPCFYDQTFNRWVKSEDIIYLPLSIWPALLDYIPKIDQLSSAIEDNSICVHSNLWDNIQFGNSEENIFPEAGCYSKVVVLLSGLELLLLLK